ncbi:hypothetical protein PAAG_12494 [Paracoccidioides lutzii Pb01]|uniref:Uncharacterized protein n=1 Tax=Paracoccidioides lutzii (strain ATCC MYA-826 / Pb01) TaxID=502779 RepID=A0A0A2VIS9_PARBA|nr:hypothetical protein PAAG_12494 [Paracoccidioides lutzii Pb01]KGQ00829.1 hypothetical protein PAAG_12494 [Paracoccidioides lutzii Pb01]
MATATSILQRHQAHPLWQKLDIDPCPAHGCPFRSEKRATTRPLHVGYAILRKATARLSPLQMQQGRPIQSAHPVRPPHPRRRGYRIGDPDAKYVLIWYHDATLMTYPESKPPHNTLAYRTASNSSMYIYIYARGAASPSPANPDLLPLPNLPPQRHARRK